jgi:hypothetical protein
MPEKILTFEPPATVSTPAAPVQYEIEKTIAGKPVRNAPVVLQDSWGNKLRAPHPPKSGCKRCYGRGFVGTDVKTNEMIPCRKCYPWNK